MKVSEAQEKTILRRFRALYPNDNVKIYGSTTGIRVVGTHGTLCEVIEHPRAYEAVLAVADTLEQTNPKIDNRFIAALALVMKEELIDLQAKNDKLIEYALALSGVHEAQEKE